MSSIQMTGMASGLDTKAIVESMLQTEKARLIALIKINKYWSGDKNFIEN